MSQFYVEMQEKHFKIDKTLNKNAKFVKKKFGQNQKKK